MSELRGVKMISVIRVSHTRGAGVDEQDPVRIVTEYFSPKGEFLCEHDDFIASDHALIKARSEIARLNAEAQVAKRAFELCNLELSASKDLSRLLALQLNKKNRPRRRRRLSTAKRK